MDEYAKLLTSVAAFIGAVAWPATLLIVVFVFRSEMKSALGRIPTVLDRVKKASLAGVVLELDRVANAEVDGAADKSGKITSQQIEAAARICAASLSFASAAKSFLFVLMTPSCRLRLSGDVGFNL